MRLTTCLLLLLTALPSAATTTPTPATPTVVLKPGSGSLDPDKTLQFTATLTNAPAAKQLRWYVNGVRNGNTTIGTIDANGLYKAPSVQPAGEGKVTVSVELWTLVAGSGSSATPPKKLAVDDTLLVIRNTAKLSLDPSYKDVGLGASFDFQTTITGAPSSLAIRWFVNTTANGNATLGTVDANGLYKAPAVLPSNSKVTLKAELLAPGAPVRVLASDTSSIQLKNLANITLAPSTATVAPGAKLQFTTTLTGAPTGYRLRYSVNGTVGGNATFGVITTAGLYTAPAATPTEKPVVKVEVLPPGTSTTVLDFDTTSLTIKFAAATITSITPATVPIGAHTLVIRGSGFRSTSTGQFNGAANPITFVSDTEVRMPVTITQDHMGSVLGVRIINPDPNPSSASSYIRGRSTANPVLSNSDAFRFLRQATWGPRPQDLDKLSRIGKTAWLDEQFALPSSTIPDTLLDKSLEYTQEHFLQLALSSNDQLRLRVAWALHKIWVVSGVEVDCADQYIPYLRILMNRSFGNYFDLMKDITLTPAMGDYLDMVNNVKVNLTNGAMPNENYAREIKQLFTLGLTTLNPNGTPKLDNTGKPIPSYTEADVLTFARVFTGWTYNDGKPGAPTQLNYYDKGGPMEAIQKYHDTDLKTLLNGAVLPANQSAETDLDAALRNIFNHPNVGPFIAKQLIQQLVTSHPSTDYVQRAAAIFNNNGQGVRGDLRAVVRAILLDPEANAVTPTSGKLMEPALYVTNMVRGLQAPVTDTPFIADHTTDMGQRVFYPPSVFSYFSPGFRIAGGTLLAPEFQIYTTATATARVNFVADLIGGRFGGNVKIPWTNLQALAADPNLLVDYINDVFLGSTMSPQMRTLILQAMLATNSSKEKAQTALYLTLVSPQYQVQR